MDARTGGVLYIVMQASSGDRYPMKGVIEEVVANERLSFTWQALDTSGNVLLRGETTALFGKQGKKTKLTLDTHAVGVAEAALAMLEGMEIGWNQSIDRLECQTAESETSDPEVIIIRTVNASRERVFNAWTDPKQLARWYAPNGCTVEIRALDVKPGGVFHHCITHPRYGACWARGVYKEVQSPERLIYTLCFADEYGNSVEPKAGTPHDDYPSETTVTVLFEDIDGKTKVTLHQTLSKALAQKTGAYPSWLEMFDRLSDVVSSN